MTKPHTTLSEAIRAMALPAPAYCDADAVDVVGDYRFYTADQIRALLTEVAELVEQHEVQEPFTASYVQFVPDRCDRILWRGAYYHLNLNAQPTLAATQAGDAKDAERYRWLRERDWFDSELCVLRDPKKVLTSGAGLGADCPSRDRLDAAIDAAIRAASKTTPASGEESDV